MLLIVQEKTVYAHADRSVKPILLIDTKGKYSDESEFVNIWLSLIDIHKMKLLKSTKLLFRFPPEKVSIKSVAQNFQIAMSSNTAYFYEDQDKDRVFRQNYHIANLSQSMFFNEILEYQVDYIIDNADSSTSSNLRQDARMQMIGIAALVTTNAYINQDSGLYPLFDQ